MGVVTTSTLDLTVEEFDGSATNNIIKLAYSYGIRDRNRVGFMRPTTNSNCISIQAFDPTSFPNLLMLFSPSWQERHLWDMSITKPVELS